MKANIQKRYNQNVSEEFKPKLSLEKVREDDYSIIYHLNTKYRIESENFENEEKLSIEFFKFSEFFNQKGMIIPDSWSVIVEGKGYSTDCIKRLIRIAEKYENLKSALKLIKSVEFGDE